MKQLRVPHHFFRTGILFAAIILLAYINSFRASWHLDDYPNITQNSGLHLSRLSAGSLKDTLFAHPSGTYRLYRPLACLTFGINWYVGQDRVFGYHVVNVGVHLVTAVFLLLTLLRLFQTPCLKDRFSLDEISFIAFLAALLWALHPIQTQAVTYIVQRMASLAAMFVIVSIYSYLCGRLTAGGLPRKVVYYGISLAAFGCATASKENAAMLPFAVLFLEIIFFGTQGVHRKRGLAAFGLGYTGCLAAAVWMTEKSLLFFLKGYPNRGFTLEQRILTEPRILWQYLSQLFYPVPQRFSIDHDIAVSTSIIDPWTTLPAILALIVLAGLGLFFIRKRSPLAAWAIVFYLLNHLVESTVLPLELVFEHRNYLPTLFVFVPVAQGIYSLLQYYRQRKWMHALIAGFASFLLIGLGMGTFVRNMDWATEGTLWADAHRKAPGRARPAFNLAKHHYQKKGDLKRALQLYEQSLFLMAPFPDYSRALSLNGMAGIYYQKKAYLTTIRLCRKALALRPDFQSAQYNLVLANLHLRRWPQAMEHLIQLQKKYPGSLLYRYLQGVVYLRLGEPDAAIPLFGQVLRQNSRHIKVKAQLGIALSRAGKVREAGRILEEARIGNPDDMQIYLYGIENRVRSGETISAIGLGRKVIDRFSVNRVNSILQSTDDYLFSIPYDKSRVQPVIRWCLRESVARLAGRDRNQ